MPRTTSLSNNVSPPEQVSGADTVPSLWVDVFILIKLYSHDLCALLYYVILNKMFIKVKNFRQKQEG